MDFINSVIDGAGAGAFACVAGASVFSRELSFCAVEDVLLELLAGVVVVFPPLPPMLTVAGFDEDPNLTIICHAPLFQQP